MSPFDLERFVAAQDAHGSHDTALTELRAGRKASHGMWWVRQRGNPNSIEIADRAGANGFKNCDVRV